MSSDPRTYLITGATGQQGGAVVDALVAHSSQSKAPMTILGVTRNPDSPSAQKLAAKSPLIKVLKGDTNNPAPLFTSARDITQRPVWGVFSVTNPSMKSGTEEAEEKQGKALIDAALDAGVKHFVQTSVDRGGDEKSWSDPTDVAHFVSKHNIELYLRERAGNTMSWTVLRPTAFYDNFKPGFGSNVFLAALNNHMNGKPLQFVATKDIGYFGAQALLKSSDPAYNNQAIGLAGDDLTVEQIVDIFKKNTTNPIAPTFGILGSALTWGMKEMGSMTRWFANYGYGADVKKCKSLNPEMLDLAGWIRTQSAFDVKK